MQFKEDNNRKICYDEDRELTDTAVEIFGSEANNREQRRQKREEDKN